MPTAEERQRRQAWLQQRQNAPAVARLDALEGKLHGSAAALAQARPQRVAADLARHAFARYGRRGDCDGLNFGDCFSYALARSTGQPLLAKGEPFARTDLTWPEVDRVRADVRSRLGLRSTTLEIDAGEVLVVFSRRALGADPKIVQDLVLALAPPGPA